MVFTWIFKGQTISDPSHENPNHKQIPLLGWHQSTTTKQNQSIDKNNMEIISLFKVGRQKRNSIPSGSEHEQQSNLTSIWIQETWNQENWNWKILTELKFPASPVVRNEYVRSFVMIEKCTGFLLSTAWMSK